MNAAEKMVVFVLLFIAVAFLGAITASVQPKATKFCDYQPTSTGITAVCN